jgi:sarcosine oxidase subunit beta
MNGPDVIIVGAGLMGASTALRLARGGKKVVLLEKGSSGLHASAVNAGGVRRLNRAFSEIPISAAAGEMWPRLKNDIGDDCGFHPVGQVRIAPGDAEMEQLADRVARVEALGYYHEEIIDAKEVIRLVPAYQAGCRGGIVTRTDGHAHPARTLRAFVRAAVNAGVELHTRCKVTDIARKGAGFLVKTGNGCRFEAEVLVNAAGAWGGRIALVCGDQLPIEPVALTMMVTGRMPPFLTPVVGIHGQKLSFKQVENGTVVIGGGHRAELNMQAGATLVKVSEIKISAATVRKHFPVMEKSTVVRTWAGIEGMVSDGLPIIGPSPEVPGLFHVCGFSSHGFQLAPMIGVLAADMIVGRKPQLSLDVFSAARFKNM